ncbi:PREDICTED: uncharacterized protein LOC109221094 isoform X1 [Nicotiana attenuata]|uniref:uncharacterized protein LOC109221094 isoform X1 n=1 Tax=Nicotiana attenuata TaxID=49451 RepID=UPI000904D5FE|nr:PREDICTED: uncharacterized protein LOC109221094 isoform X1 [Nicotiana attenuata]
MGYGVVRPTLGGLTAKVLLLGITYFVASILLNITEYVGTINDIAGRARVLLVLPDALLDAFLILWIFTSLSKTLEQLQIQYLNDYIAYVIGGFPALPHDPLGAPRCVLASLPMPSATDSPEVLATPSDKRACASVAPPISLTSAQPQADANNAARAVPDAKENVADNGPVSTL